MQCGSWKSLGRRFSSDSSRLSRFIDGFHLLIMPGTEPAFRFLSYWRRLRPPSGLTGEPLARKVPILFGAIAQLGERLHGMQEVGGSIPPGSTKQSITWQRLSPDLPASECLVPAPAFDGMTIRISREIDVAVPVCRQHPHPATLSTRCHKHGNSPGKQRTLD